MKYTLSTDRLSYLFAEVLYMGSECSYPVEEFFRGLGWKHPPSSTSFVYRLNRRLKTLNFGGKRLELGVLYYDRIQKKFKPESRITVRIV